MRPLPAPPLQHGWHCVYDLHYHLVFAVKYRRALLDPAVVAELARLSLEVQERYESGWSAWGPTATISTCCVPRRPSWPRPTSCGSTRASRPASCSRRSRVCGRRLRQELWGGAFWSGGYFVSTVGQRGGYKAIKRYVQSQGQTPEEASLRLLFEEPDES